MQFDIHHIDQVNSTNSFAFKICTREIVKEGTVFSTRKQYAGKGYRNNIWLSEQGKNLTFSLIIRPDFISPSEQFIITQIVSLAVADLLKELVKDKPVYIKWPNDLYIGEGKVCGILVQNSIMGEQIDFSIVGIGLNVNQTEFPELLSNPVSLIRITGREYNLEEMLNMLLQHINNRYEAFRSNPDRNLLQEAYLSNLYRFREVSGFQDKDDRFEGQITGVDEYGRLEIELANGTKKLYNFKEVMFV